MATTVVIGIDTGGTFTDLVAIAGGRLRVHKVLSTPGDPARAVITGLKAMLEGATHDRNRVLLPTNAGFEDLIEVGRQNRSDLYALAPERPEPLIARTMRLGVAERTYFDGKL